MNNEFQISKKPPKVIPLKTFSIEWYIPQGIVHMAATLHSTMHKMIEMINLTGFGPVGTILVWAQYLQTLSTKKPLNSNKTILCFNIFYDYYLFSHAFDRMCP